MPDPDDAARATLSRYRRIAGGLLLGMAFLTLASHAMPSLYWVELLRAAATAGLVGGLADWFAVTALFRHPLGLPIPHTAIIPAQKARLGRALGGFVANHVINQTELQKVLGRLDVPSIFNRFLADPASVRPAAQALAGLLPRLIATVEDGRARKVAARLLPRLLGGPDAGRVVGRALRQMVAGGRHQEVFSFILNQLKTLLLEREETLRAAIEERVREQGGRLIGWALGASIARRVLSQINAELEKMEPDGSELRAAFDVWMRHEIDRIETESGRAAEIGAALRQVVAHDTVRAWFWDVWSRMRLALEADAAKPNGRTVVLIEAALTNLGAMLATDAGARERVDRAVAGVTGTLLPAAQARLADFIADVVGNWDAAVLVEKLELRVGKDLQYVRINGTLVGFLAGGVVFALMQALFAR
ncbi:MAG: DUF445 domain-containing protein [Alphaproteobacteria bacterium]|nr:DUF445 domain-containing protein [Alphaproteobacteria bacterium]